MGSELVVILNWIVSSVGGYICMCRMSRMSESETKLQIRIQYMIWFSLFTVSGLSFLFGELATPVQLLMSFAVVAHLLIGIPVWRWETPAYTKKQDASREANDAFLARRFNQRS